MNLTLTKPNGSHWLAPEHGRGGQLAREELYPVLTAEVRGVERTVRVSADRYRHSNGWSDWRIYVRDVEPSNGIGDKTRAGLNAAAEPIVRAWLASDAYKASRRLAAAAMLARLIRDERYNAYSVRTELARHRAELSDADAARLTRAVDALQTLLENLDR